MEGKQPIVKIADEQYRVDLKRDLLYPLDSNKDLAALNLLDFEIMISENYEYYGYYDLNAKKMIVFESDITELPHGVVAVVLPRASELDPVAWAEMHGRTYDPERDEPVVEYREALVIPIERSDLAIVVEENRIQQPDDFYLIGKAALEKNDATMKDLPDEAEPGKKKNEGEELDKERTQRNRKRGLGL